MVILNFSTTIDDFIAQSNSLISIYVNDKLAAYLSNGKKEYSGQILLADKKTCIVVKRAYLKPTNNESRNLLQKILSTMASLFVLSGTAGEPFSCLYESEERIEIEPTADSAKVSVFVYHTEDRQWPLVRVTAEKCTVESASTVRLSVEELDDAYAERKRLALIPLKLSLVLLCIGLFLLIAFGNITTLVFLFAIACLVAGCTTYSLRALKKQYLRMREQLL